uniref:AMP-dependent synthetase/ligase domain-containing protein n=1 Tax=Polytomella parva TaxID=51329 RepID=A0A7S0YMV6_9CHLO
MPLAYGGTVDFMSKFTPSAWWTRIKGSKSIPNGPSPPTVFMGVPPMYNYILAQYDKMDDVRQAEARRAVQGLRLAISGSSACPVPILERWRAIAGDYLLERFGMTEIGMAVSNPLAGPRLAGTVGPPLPLVTAKLSGSGELLVKGPTLFKEYWRRPEATQEAFDEDGFFKTGDASSMRLGPLPDRLPYYVIEGRLSVDIIKCLGFKVSALHVESVIMENPSLAEIAVVGVKDDSYGERIVAIVAFSDKVKGTRKPSANELREFSVDRLAPYQVPRDWHVVDAIPRNAMGKVNKKDLVKRLIAGEFESLK